MSLGGKGSISVLSNILPKVAHDIPAKFLAGDFEGSRNLQLEYLDLCNNLFVDVNPIPVKEAMAMLGYCDAEMREPLYPMDEAKKAVLREKLIEAGLTVKA